VQGAGAGWSGGRGGAGGSCGRALGPQGLQLHCQSHRGGCMWFRQRSVQLPAGRQGSPPALPPSMQPLASSARCARRACRWVRGSSPASPPCWADIARASIPLPVSAPPATSHAPSLIAGPGVEIRGVSAMQPAGLATMRSLRPAQPRVAGRVAPGARPLLGLVPARQRQQPQQQPQQLGDKQVWVARLTQPGALPARAGGMQAIVVAPPHAGPPAPSHCVALMASRPSVGPDPRQQA